MARAHDGSLLHDGFLRHADFRWLKVAAAVCLVAWLAYLLIDVDPRPNGGSAYGYTLGTISALLILWLTALGLRKRVVTSRPFSVKGWTSAHVYLGLSLVVLATLHTGFQLGWNVHTLAYVLMMIVIASGVFGIVAYARLPMALGRNRGEVTQPQMLANIAALDRQIHDAAQTLDRRLSDIVRQSLEDSPVGGGVWRRLRGESAPCGNRNALAALQDEQRAAGGLADPRLAPLVALLDKKAQALGLARRHVRLKTLLEIWLFVHVPVTFMLIAALAAHIVSVFFYW